MRTRRTLSRGLPSACAVALVVGVFVAPRGSGPEPPHGRGHVIETQLPDAEEGRRQGPGNQKTIGQLAASDPARGAGEPAAPASPSHRSAPSPLTSSTVGAGGAEAVPGEVLVQLAADGDLSAGSWLADAWGTRILSQGRWSGTLRVAVPEGMSVTAFAAAVARDPAVAWAGPNHLIRATSVDCDDEAETLGDIQWPLDRSAADATCAAWGPEGPVGIRVAILDSGLAYEDYSDGQGTYAMASGLAGAQVDILPGADTLNGDDHPNDDNGHGTHLASIIASGSDLTGAAPGVVLVPLKVLDAAGLGTEASLIDGLHLAAEASLDVVNLSLSFDERYRPSWALQQAIRAVQASGAVVVASSGNRHLERVHHPAALPDVVAVGASRLSGGVDCQAPGTPGDVVAAYTSGGFALDLIAPGGSIVHDSNCDSYIDAIYAETLEPGDPTSLAFRGLTGTSQAAAHVSAAAAWLLAESPSLTADQLRAALVDSARDLVGAGYSPGFDAASGAGTLDMEDAVASALADPPTAEWAYVDILPVLYAEGADKVRGYARVRVVRQTSAGAIVPMTGVKVMGSWQGAVDEEVVISTDSSGYASSYSSPALAIAPDGTPLPVRMSFSVLAVAQAPGSGARPLRARGYYHLSEGLERALDLLYGDGTSGGDPTPSTADTVVLFDVDPADSALATWFDLSKLRPGLVYKVLGAGGITAPAAAVFSDASLPEIAAGAELSLDLGESLSFGWGASDSLGVTFYGGGPASLSSAPSVSVLRLDGALLTAATYTQPVLNAVWDEYDAAVVAFNPAFADSPLKDRFSALIQGNGYSKTIFGTITSVELNGDLSVPLPTATSGAGGESDEGEAELGSCTEDGCLAEE